MPLVLIVVATTLQSIGTQPFDWMTCLVSWTSCQSLCLALSYFATFADIGAWKSEMAAHGFMVQWSTSPEIV